MKKNFSKQTNMNAGAGAADVEDTTFEEQMKAQPVENNAEGGKKEKGVKWRNAAMGGAAGVAAVVLGGELNAQENGNAENGDQENENGGEVIEAQATDADNMSFGEAFAHARAEMGPGQVFEWHGNSYTTDYREEVENHNQDDTNQDEVQVDEGDSEIEVLGVNDVEEVIGQGANDIDGENVIVVDIEPDVVVEPDMPDMVSDEQVDMDGDYTNDAIV